MTQTREKWDSLVLSRADFCIVGRCRGIPCFHFLFFCLEATVKKNTWMRTISVTVMVIISKVLLWKLLDFSYVQSYLSAITRYIDNDIWKILYSGRFYGDGSTYMLILSWVNIMKWKWANVRRKLSVAQNPCLFLEEHCTRTFHLLLYCSLPLKQT